MITFVKQNVSQNVSRAELFLKRFEMPLKLSTRIPIAPTDARQEAEPNEQAALVQIRSLRQQGRSLRAILAALNGQALQYAARYRLAAGPHTPYHSISRIWSSGWPLGRVISSIAA